MWSVWGEQRREDFIYLGHAFRTSPMIKSSYYLSDTFLALEIGFGGLLFRSQSKEKSHSNSRWRIAKVKASTSLYSDDIFQPVLTLSIQNMPRRHLYGIVLSFICQWKSRCKQESDQPRYNCVAFQVIATEHNGLSLADDLLKL